jgi:hypothetical protein
VNHIPDTGKMVSDTPRTDAELVEMTTGYGPVVTKTTWVHSSLCFQLERELNAANSKIELLMSANADVAHIADERDAAEKRIRLLIAERDTARRQADQNYKLREEFAELLGTDDVEHGVAVVREMKERIKRLEEVGDNLSDCADQIGWTSCESPQWIKKAENAVKEWRKAKEDKP